MPFRFFTFSGRLGHMLIQLFTNIKLQHVSFFFFFITETKNCNKLPVFLYLVSLSNWNCLILGENSNVAGSEGSQLTAGSFASLN